jgi:hypothetical protein
LVKQAFSDLTAIYRQNFRNNFESRQEFIRHAAELNRISLAIQGGDLEGGAVAKLVGIESGVVSGVINLESPALERAQWGSMAKAAKRLSVSHPVVSKAISDLEQALGVRLLDRAGCGTDSLRSRIA